MPPARGKAGVAAAESAAVIGNIVPLDSAVKQALI